VTTGERPKVLVVDDSAAARLSLDGVLSEEFDVVTVADAAAAERTLATTPIDVVVSDHQLDQGWGLDFLIGMRARYPDTVGILVTGHRERPEVEAALDNWQELTVILKPYDPDRLIREVRNAVHIARLRRATSRLRR
jgi:two-component system, NtrC family, response regulator HupR/HoxA